METIKRSAHAVDRRIQDQFHDKAIRSGGYYMFDNDDGETESSSEPTTHVCDRKLSVKSQSLDSMDTSSDMSAASSLVTSKDDPKIKKFLLNCLRKVVAKMHSLSKNYIHISKKMEEERKNLIATMSPLTRDAYRTM